jgi:hypothetical protein
VVDFKNRTAQSNIAAKAESSLHKHWHEHCAFHGDSGEKELCDKVWDSKATCLCDIVNSRVDGLNDSLADVMHNVTQSAANKRMLENENAEQKEAELFAEKCVKIANCAPENHHVLKHWFVWLNTLICEEWTIAIKEVDFEDLLEEHVDENDVDCILEGSQGTVHCIAGCLLRSMLKVGMKDEQAGIKKNVEHNAACNRLSEANLACLDLPTQVVDLREIHTGALKRVCPAFFRFACPMEALHKVNLTPAVACVYGQNVFHKVDGVVKKNKELAALFHQCVPSSCSPVEREQLMKKMFKLALRKCSLLRARDTLCNVKANTSSSAGGRDFSTRTAAAASIYAAPQKSASNKPHVDEGNDDSANERHQWSASNDNKN